MSPRKTCKERKCRRQKKGSKEGETEVQRVMKQELAQKVEGSKYTSKVWVEEERR